MATKTEKDRPLRRELIGQFITLSTSGFGLVTALAWNETVQAFVKEYVEKYFPAGSGVLSKFLYAILITFLAVVITYQLSRIASRWDVKR